MIKLGEKQRLSVVKKVDFGVYLAEFMPKRGENLADIEKVLLPRKQVPQGFDVGDSLEVFIYKDSQDRLIATVNEPYLTLHEVAKLEVVAVSHIGAFLSWGLEKDLFLPFKQQTKKVQVGDRVLAALYIDKSERLAATMKVYPYLPTGGEYKKDDEVTGTIYEIAPNFGIFVAIDDKYQGMIPIKEPANELHVGDVITARVTNVKADGKVDLSVRKKAHLQVDDDSTKILSLLEEYGGKLPIGDKSAPETIREITGMSKNEFKRATGHLYKLKKIKPSDDSVVLL